MKNAVLLVVLFFFFLLTIFSGISAYAAKEKSRKLWNNMCASCHDGKTAPDAEMMRSKYKTVDEFVTAVRGKGSRCMNVLKNNEPTIRKIAAEIGIKEAQAK